MLIMHALQRCMVHDSRAKHKRFLGRCRIFQERFLLGFPAILHLLSQVAVKCNIDKFTGKLKPAIGHSRHYRMQLGPAHTGWVVL